MDSQDNPDSLQASSITFEFSGAIWFWKGPAPYYFLTIPEAPSRELKEMIHLITYGWGMVPVRAKIGGTEFTTSMFYKDGRYVLPVKDSVRKAERIDEGDEVTARIDVQVKG